MKAGKGKRPVKRLKRTGGLWGRRGYRPRRPHPRPQPEPAPARRRCGRALAERIGWAAWGLFSALLLVFYFWTATSSNQPFRPRDTSQELYGQLAAAFQKGQTYLDTKPAPQLLAMSDPYDPAANEPYRLHDASLYRGKYYVYFGAAPVVVFTCRGGSDREAAFGRCGGDPVLLRRLRVLLPAVVPAAGGGRLRPPWWLRAAAVLASV